MTIDISSTSSMFSSATISSGSIKTQQSNSKSEESSVLNMTSTSAASADSSTSELTEEEKLYDLDSDGVLSLSEEAAYLKAQADKKAAEATTSGTSSEEKIKQSIQKMQSESSLKQSQILGKMQQASDKPEESTIKRLDQEDANQERTRMKHASDSYSSYQNMNNLAASLYNTAV